MDKGWVKLHRKLLDSPIFGHEGLLKLWALCLLKASHKKHEATLPGLLSPIKLTPGQFVTGRDRLHEDYHLADSKQRRYSRKLKPTAITLYRWLQNMQRMQMLNITPHNKYSIITIVNWPLYQEGEHQVNNSCTSNEHKQECNKNIYSCEFFKVNSKQHDKYLKAYPGLNLEREYRKMEAWLESNPKKRKTPKGYPRFINNWLSKAFEQNKQSPSWRDELPDL